MEWKETNQAGVSDDDKTKRKNKYKRIRSKTKEHYSLKHGKPPLPQHAYGKYSFIP